MRLLKRLHDARAFIACLALLVLVTIGVMGQGEDGGRPAPEGGVMTAIARCQADLAQWLKVNPADAKVISTQETTWPDSALGMPKPHGMYAQALVPGWVMVLEVQNTRYLYTASETTCKFGGLTDLWAYSMLYIKPVPNDPNRICDLYQCSLMGTNHVRILSGINACYPQQKGAILATRHTSHSSSELLYVTAAKDAQPVTLYKAFFIGEATLNDKQDTWAALVCPRLRAVSQIVVAPVGQNDPTKQKILPLPDRVRPVIIAYVGDRVLLLASMNTAARTQNDASTVVPPVLGCWQITPSADKPEWKEASITDFPELGLYVLNKSESLEVTQRTEKNFELFTDVARVLPNGDRKVRATISGIGSLTITGYTPLGTNYAFISGITDGVLSVYTVNMDTGEVIRAANAPYWNVKPFEFPPISSPLQALERAGEKTR